MLRKIKLENFKCFREISIPVRPVSVLAGLNGAGKSTVLQSLLLTKQSVYSNGTLEFLNLEGNTIKMGAAGDILCESAPDNLIHFTFNDEEKECSLAFCVSDSGMEKQIATEGQPIIVPTWISELRYLSAFRISPQNSYDMIGISKSKVFEYGNNGEFCIQFLAEYGRRNIAQEKMLPMEARNDSGTTIQDAVAYWLNFISPGVIPVVRAERDTGNATLQFEYLEGDHKSRTHRNINVGFGITYVLPIVVAIMAAKPGDLLLLENPEAHVHPGGQIFLGRMIALAAGCGIQLLVETHSDHVMNGIRLAVHRGEVSSEAVNFLYFERSREGEHTCREIHTDRKGKLSEWPKGFFDSWDEALTELLRGN
ncbi:MAG: DUF3696 domain-containing protein [Lachnospiraceae bacterium]|nr:DUF3696 domain-containing protein [Lachnospiraceae bacterium]